MIDMKEDERELWPAKNWGPPKIGQEGEVQIHFDYLGDYQEGFMNMITLDVLKKLTTPFELFDLIDEINERLKYNSDALKKMTSCLQKESSTEDMRKRIGRAEQVKTFAQRQQVANQDKRLPVGLTQKFMMQPQKPRNEYSRSYEQYNPRARFSNIEQEEEEQEVEYFDDDYIFEDSDQHPDAPIGHNEETEFEDESRDYYPDGLASIMGGGKASPGKVDRSTLPCYKYFTGKCKGDCGGFSHKDEDMKKCLQEKLEEIYDSAYGGFDRMQSGILSLQRTRPPKPIASPNTGNSNSGNTKYGNTKYGQPNMVRPGHTGNPRLLTRDTQLQRPAFNNPRLSLVESQGLTEDDQQLSASADCSS